MDIGSPITGPTALNEVCFMGFPKMGIIIEFILCLYTVRALDSAPVGDWARESLLAKCLIIDVYHNTCTYSLREKQWGFNV